MSIVVPNFNHRQFLPERFNSIFAQTYRNIEICFLDDASGDDSVEYVRGLASPFRLNIDVNKENSGSAFRQWARGLSLTRGEFVWIAEADDSCAPEFLERLVALARRNPSAGFVYSQSRIIDEQWADAGGNTALLERDPPVALAAGLLCPRRQTRFRIILSFATPCPTPAHASFAAMRCRR